jgi:hypothetical protein
MYAQAINIIIVITYTIRIISLIEPDFCIFGIMNVLLLCPQQAFLEIISSLESL